MDTFQAVIQSGNSTIHTLRKRNTGYWTFNKTKEEMLEHCHCVESSILYQNIILNKSINNDNNQPRHSKYHGTLQVGTKECLIKIREAQRKYEMQLAQPSLKQP